MSSVLTSAMSEQNEHTLKETHPQQIKAEKLSKEQTKSKEIMHINAVNSSKNDKSTVQSKEQQDLVPPEDECNRSSCLSDDETGSVYYIASSEDETTHSYNDEDDDRYMDNEDMHEADLANRHKNAMLEDEEDDDDEGHRLRLHIHDNDDTDTEYEQDCFDSASDDFVLNKRLNQHHKEQSLSLQDLSNYKRNTHTQYNKRRHSLILKRKYLNLQPNLVAYSNIHKTMPLKYRRVENKGTSIIKQQVKKSRDMNMKDQESATHENHQRNEDNDIEQLNTTNESTKDNTKTTINESQTEETQSANLIYNTMQIVENNGLPDRIIENGYMSIENIQYNHVQNEKYTQNSDGKLENVNESIDVSMQMECNDAEMIEAQEIDNNDTSCSIKITNVKSIRLTPDEPENFSFAKTNAVDRLNAEITELKTQLRQFHQKTLTENIKMQQEIDGLKKSLAKYEDESQTCETNDAIENGTIIETTSKQDIVASGHLNNQNEDIIKSDGMNKMSSSSIEPTINRTNETVETAHNTAKSTESSNLASVLNTEDNITLSTSTTSKNLTQLSSTFVTSTRILQTLSNIMQGKVESSLPNNTRKRLNENSIQTEKSDSPIITSSKKRKAEVLGTPSYVQHFKIPNASTESENKITINAPDVKLECSVEHPNVKPRQEHDKTLIDKTINDSTCMQTKVEHTNDHEDNVKYFVYKNPNNVGNGSFLIQAEEPINNRESEKDRIQECGPFLFGNLEVRMSEINGKINIWGKELNHDYESDSEDDLEASEKSSQKKAYWQDTSQTKFNRSPFVCSTNKKKKNPSRFNRSNISQCGNLPFNSINALSLENINDKRHIDSFKRMSCENCNSSKCENSWPRCNHVSNLQERIHSCCMHHTQITNEVCNCEFHRKKLDVSCKCCEDKFHSVGLQQNLCTDAHVSNSKSSSNCINYQIASSRSSQDRYGVPLKRSTEIVEMKKQKLNGERVRGILMDFLRAHEGGRDISAADPNENSAQQKESPHRLNDPQQIRSSTSTQSNDSYRCCRTCESRLATQIGKLEMRMERVQSRLNVIIDMLNKLQPMDIN